MKDLLKKLEDICFIPSVIALIWAMVVGMQPKLRGLTRRMRRYNRVPGLSGGTARNMPTVNILEDAVHKDSLHSYFIQLADVNAYFLHQKFAPCSYVKNKGARNYFSRLDPVLCRAASRAGPEGIVFR